MISLIDLIVPFLRQKHRLSVVFSYDARMWGSVREVHFKVAADEELATHDC